MKARPKRPRGKRTALSSFYTGNTKAYSEFLGVYGRSIRLAGLSILLQQKSLKDSEGQIPDVDAHDPLRAAVVIAVSAMDSYFTSRFVDMLVPFLKCKGPTNALVDMLAKAGLDTRQCLVMISMERPYRRVRTLVDGYLDKYVTQRFSAIDSLFLAYGLKHFSKRVQERLKRQKLLSRIEVLVLRRHEIVHGGDLNAHGRLRPLNGSDTLKRIEEITRFVAGAEALLNNFLKIKRLSSPAQHLARVWADAWKLQPGD